MAYKIDYISNSKNVAYFAYIAYYLDNECKHLNCLVYCVKNWAFINWINAPKIIYSISIYSIHSILACLNAKYRLIIAYMVSYTLGSKIMP